MPSVVIVNPHVLSQSLLPRVRLMTNLTLVYPLPVVPYHVLLQILLLIEALTTFRTHMVAFHEMHFLSMIR